MASGLRRESVPSSLFFLFVHEEGSTDQGRGNWRPLSCSLQLLTRLHVASFWLNTPVADKVPLSRPKHASV